MHSSAWTAKDQGAAVIPFDNDISDVSEILPELCWQAVDVPVNSEVISSHFISAAALRYRWDSEKAIGNGVRMYTNYAIDLGLVGKIGSNYFVTPSGVKFVLLLNMHKSLRLIENTRRIE